jgi:hypothetical protein
MLWLVPGTVLYRLTIVYRYPALMPEARSDACFLFFLLHRMHRTDRTGQDRTGQDSFEWNAVLILNDETIREWMTKPINKSS